MNLSNILVKACELNASDAIVTSNVVPCYKINGEIIYDNDIEVISNQELSKELDSIIPKNMKKVLEDNQELDFSIQLKGYSRFRVNIFFTKNGIASVFRVIKNNLPSLKELNIPKEIFNLCNKKGGLILVTGGVGSGKSTTLSILIEYINANFAKHIITIEDPIEYVFKNNKSILEQREVGTNTKSFDNGLKYALRQSSDVIMIGEMRDLETFRLALRAAETGNLVFATLHTSGAARTVSRIIDMFPGDEKDQIKTQLADSLLGVIWQDLIKTKKGDSRILSSELMINNSTISNMIRKGNIHQIDGAIETGGEFGMYTMKKNLENLKKEGIIN